MKYTCLLFALFSSCLFFSCEKSHELSVESKSNKIKLDSRSTMCGIDTEGKDCNEVTYDFVDLLVDMAHCTEPNVYEACYWSGSISYMVCVDPLTGEVEVNVSDLNLEGHHRDCALDENGDKLDHWHDVECISEEVMKVIIPIIVLKEAQDRYDGLHCERSEYIVSNYSKQSCISYCPEYDLAGQMTLMRIVPCGTEACCVTKTKWCLVDGRLEAVEETKSQTGSCVPEIGEACSKKGKGDGGYSWLGVCQLRNCN